MVLSLEKRKNMKNKHYGVILIIILVLVGGYFYSNKKNDDEIKIGVILTMTGRASYIGGPDQNAVKLAEKEINSLYPNKKVRVIVEDSQSDSKGAATAAQKLINVDHVDALFVEVTAPTLAVAPIAKNANIPLIYSSFVESPVNDYPNALKSFIDYGDVCLQYAKYLSSIGVTNVASIDDSNGLGNICAESMRSVLGKDNVKEVPLKPETDVRVEILKLKSEGYKAVASINFEPTVIKLMKAMKENNYNPIFMCQETNCTSKTVEDAVGVGSLKNVVYFYTVTTKSFKDAYTSAYGEIPTSAYITASFDYNAMYDLYGAIVSCKKGNTSCIVEQAQKQTNYKSAVENYAWKDRIVSLQIHFGNYVNDKKEELIMK
jgi:ABC-type branched-subunit amino acid transport system substrate-binding protein